MKTHPHARTHARTHTHTNTHIKKKHQTSVYPLSVWDDIFFYLIDLSLSIMRGVEIYKVKGIGNARRDVIFFVVISSG